MDYISVANKNSGLSEHAITILSKLSKYFKIFIIPHHAVRTQAPPTALILSSALLEKNLAFTMTGRLGSRPLPRTL